MPSLYGTQSTIPFYRHLQAQRLKGAKMRSVMRSSLTSKRQVDPHYASACWMARACLSIKSISLIWLLGAGKQVAALGETVERVPVLLPRPAFAIRGTVHAAEM